MKLTAQDLAETDPVDSLPSILSLMHRVGLIHKLAVKRRWQNLSKLGNAYPVMAQAKVLLVEDDKARVAASGPAERTAPLQ